MNDHDNTEKITGDIGAQRIAGVYAEALLNAAQMQEQGDAVLEGLEFLIGEVFHQDPQFEAFLSSGAIGRDRKAQAIKTIFENRLGELVYNFLMVLNQHGRLDLLRPILAALRKLLDQRSGRLRVHVRTAIPLPDDQRNRLQQELRETFKREPVLEAAVDPDLLGGMVVRVGDWLYDASVRTQIENLRNHLIASSSHEIQSRRDRFSIASGN
jgi:F-type H+-transporting ATPase subunit delta